MSAQHIYIISQDFGVEGQSLPLYAASTRAIAEQYAAEQHPKMFFDAPFVIVELEIDAAGDINEKSLGFTNRD